jgi:phage tail-like protein
MSLFAVFETMAPVVEAVQAIYERSPRLARHLPEIFHKEAERKLSPLWALLLLIEDNFASISKIINEIDKYFDIWRAPAGVTSDEPDFVTWLGTWVALIPEQHWTVQKKRYALSIAADLHKYRGTINGLRSMLALFFEIEVEIDEWDWPDGMQIGVHNTIDVDTRIDDQYNINNCFTVTWKPKPEEIGPDLKQKIAGIRAMIEREKPAHTFCYLKVVGYEE